MKSNIKMIHEPKQINLKCIIPLCLLYMTVYLASASVAYKMVQFGPVLEPGPPFIFPLSYAIADIITEVYGARLAKQIIWMTLACELFFALVVSLIVKLPAPHAWLGQDDYSYVFGHILRFVMSGIVAVSTSSLINVYIISRFKFIMKGKKFWVRGLLSSGLGGIALVTIIILLGYSGSISFMQALRMWVSINILEMMYVLVLLGPVWFTAVTLKKIEGLDVYDKTFSLNPFK